MDPTTKPTPSTSSPMRVLIRPPPQPPQPPQPPPSPAPQPPPQQQPPSTTTGTTVVGFIGAHPTTMSHLINCIIDSHIFGSGGQDTSLELGDVSDEVKGWFKRRKISYYHDFDKGLILLTMCSTKFPDEIFDFSDDLDLGNLQGLLFMFVVCHVIIYVQEGSYFNTQTLKTLRVLQTAKHALKPFLRSHSNSLFPSNTKSSSSSSSSALSSRPPTPVIPSKSPPPRRGSGMSIRNSSTSTVTSCLGSYTALFPGQCTPITLFVFIDDFSDMLNSSSLSEDSNDPTSTNQSTTSNLSRSNFPVKGSSSSSVVVLSRPSNKVETGMRKLQSSLETQVRFLIKKCRTLSGSDSSAHVGSRGGSTSGLTPLLTLDSSRAILLIDRSRTQSGGSLDFATSLVEDVLNGKVTPDSLLLESHGRSGNKEDIMALKEFVFRQADILRGKGGSGLNTNSGSASGVGMVAVAAAAAAAASAASGRATSVPELPRFETWLSSSQVILKGILSAKRNSIVDDDTDVIRRKFRQRIGTEGVPSKSPDSPDNPVSLLECEEDIDRKFSSLWCQRVLPSAMEVYLKDLPPCYPTSQHEAHLDKALRAFHSMVKGPSVPQFMRKLEEECLLVWKNGRQLCDAVSLTGKPCMHQRHDTEDESKEHCSGFVFLHACSCGRSRQLRPDPFDFGSANIGFNVFPDCDKLLPLFQLPKDSTSGINQPLSWTILRLGGARYYEPSKGVLQPGFSLNSKFLLRWTIVLGKDKWSSVSFADALKQRPSSGNVAIKSKSTSDEDAKKNTTPVLPGEVQSGNVGPVKDDNGHKYDNKKSGLGRGRSLEAHSTVEPKQISFGRGLPNITMKKAFAEVVAGSTSSSSAFPPLQSRIVHTSPAPAPVKSIKKIATKPENINQDNPSSNNNPQIPEKSIEVSSAGEVKSNKSNNNPILHIGSNVIPLKVDDSKNGSEKNITEGGNSRFNPSCRHFVVYVGFEHECPRGHRFFLTPELLNQLGKPYSLPEESHVNSKQRGSSKSGNNSVHKRAHRLVNMTSHLSQQVEQSAPSEMDLQENVHSLSVDDNGHAFSLINRSLPIYMDCPHCKASKDKKDRQSLKFAGTISQLQRIFVVTPPFPIVLVANPIVQFERSYQPAEVSNHDHQLQFGLGCQVILPPESVVAIRLPFIYGIEVKDKGMCPLNPFDNQPELTAWIVQGTTLKAIYKPNSSE